MSGQSPKRGSKPIFGDEERTRIRNAMEFYRKKNGLSVAKLQEEIAKAIGDDKSRIPFKSLQRFLSNDDIRTDDILVSHFETFMIAVTPPPPEEAFADGLARFLLHEAEDIAGIYDGLSGTYFSYIVTRDPETEKIDWAPYSKLELSETAQGHYLLAHEKIFNLTQDPYWQGEGLDFFTRGESAPKTPSYAGVLCYAQQRSFYLFMRGYLHSRVSMLKLSPPAGGDEKQNLFGSVQEPFHRLRWTSDMRSDFYIRYFRAENMTEALCDLQKKYP